MWTRLLLVLLVLFGIWYYLNQKKAPPPQTGAAGETAAASGSGDCLLFAGSANASLASAISAASRPPVDQADWSRTEAEVSSAISRAESACGGSDDASRALSLMRASLTEIAAGARGEGGTMGVAARQGEIDDLLNHARGQ
ncbi:MAG: hypothetical protein ACHQPI_11400 [Thermoanaerobaculia bacterium]